MTGGYHPVTWFVWTVALAIVALMTLNPLYLALLALAALGSFLAVSQHSTLSGSWAVFLKVGLLIWAVTIPFNALMVHAGQHVLFALPAHWPLIGGNITLEAVSYGFVRGLSLIIVLMAFATFNSAVDQARLLRRMPSFLYLVSMVASIALAFVPQMVNTMREIQEAQRIRGHRFHGVRDLLPLFVPLLTTGMERAIQLAESMESRGFGGNIASISPKRDLLQKILTLVGLLLLLFGVFALSYWTRQREYGIAITLAGAGILIVVFWLQSRRVKRTRYRRERWMRRDWIVTGVSAGALMAILATRLADITALFYYPYPPYAIWPAFEPRVGVLLLPFALPALMLPRRAQGQAGAISTGGEVVS